MSLKHFAYASSLLIVVLVGWRLQYGIDFTDESYYLALPYRFSLGDLPYRDEWSIGQNAGILLQPLWDVYCQGQAPCDGVVFYFRILYFSLCLLNSVLSFFFARVFIPRSGAILSALTVVTFVPFNIFGLSYNTLGCLGLTASSLLLFLQSAGSPFWKSRWVTVLIGVLSAIASFAYPPIVPAFLALGVLAVSFSPHRKRTFGFLVLGALLATLPLLPFIFPAFFQALPAMQQLSDSYEVYGYAWEKLGQNFLDLWEHRPASWFLMVLAGVAIILRKSPRKWFALPVALLYLQLAQDYTGSLFGHGVVLFTVLFAAPFLLKAYDKQERAARVLLGVPSLISALMMSWSSSNGIVNAAIGLVPLFLLSNTLMGRRFYLASFSKKIAWFGEARLIGLLLMVQAVLVWGMYQQDSVYREARLFSLNTRVESGPFRGLLSTQGRIHYLDRLQGLVSESSPDSRRILFFYQFPAGFLLTSKRPAVCSLWMVDHGSAPEVYEQCFRRHLSEPVTAVKILEKSLRAEDPLTDGVRAKLQLKKKTSDFELFESL